MDSLEDRRKKLDNKCSRSSSDSESEIEMVLIEKKCTANRFKRKSMRDTENNPVLKSGQFKVPLQVTSRRILYPKALIIGTFNDRIVDSGEEKMSPNNAKQKLLEICKKPVNNQGVLVPERCKTTKKRLPRWITKHLLKEVKVKLSEKRNREVSGVEIDKVIFKLITFVRDITSFRRKTGLTALIDEFIRYLYKCGLIRTCMDYYAFCLDYLPPNYIYNALRDPLRRTTKSKVLGSKLLEDLRL